MRIALFAETFLPKWDGIANTLCHLLEHLAGSGHDCLMFAPSGAPPQYAGTTIVGLPSLAFPLYPTLKLVPPVVDVRRRLVSFRPDLIHSVNPAFLGLVGLRHARELDVPAVASYHTDIPGYAARYRLPFLHDPLWTYFRWIHNQADLNLCPSCFTRKQLIAHGFERVRIWGRGVDAERFNPSQRSDEWRDRMSGGCPDAPLLLYVGRLAAEKRVDWLRPLLDAIPQVRLAIVGDGPARGELEAIFAGTPAVFQGYLTGLDLARAYASADVFVFPSANETFGNVVIEAMASGLPVVAPDSGGPVDHITSGQNGFLFSSNSIDDMTAKVQQMVSSPSLTRQLGANARAYARVQSWPAVLNALLEEYAALIIDRRPLRRQVKAFSSLVRRPRYSPSSGLG